MDIKIYTKGKGHKIITYHLIPSVMFMKNIYGSWIFTFQFWNKPVMIRIIFEPEIPDVSIWERSPDGLKRLADQLKKERA